MDGHIDWLSFTLETEVEPFNHAALYSKAHYLTKVVGDEIEQIIFSGTDLDVSTSRAPYRLALRTADNGLSVYGHSGTGTVLYELAGRHCERFRGTESGRLVCARLSDRITRFDYAVDIPCQTLPADFANKRTHHAFRTISFIRSDTGETAYVGSPKSDRFCRVYRYNAPHPRSHLLRVEFVFRRGLARAAALEYSLTSDEGRFIAKLGETWGWSHHVWRPTVRTDERLRVPILTKTDHDTVAWLYKQVAPAVGRLMRESSFDLVEWLEYVYNQ